MSGSNPLASSYSRLRSDSSFALAIRHLLCDRVHRCHMCPACRDLHVELDRQTPGLLARAIRMAQANVADRTLVPAQPSRGMPLDSPPSIANVQPDGPWDDVI